MRPPQGASFFTTPMRQKTKILVRRALILSAKRAPTHQPTNQFRILHSAFRIPHFAFSIDNVRRRKTNKQF